MWARSSRRNAPLLPLLPLLPVLLAACPRQPKAPEADPAVVKALAAKMAQNIPAPQAARPCRDADYANIPTLTYVTLLQLGDLPVKADPQHADWINPPELESPEFHALTRQAAAKLLSAPAWMVYKVDMVNAPMALGYKELKISTIGARAIRFNKNAIPECVEIFYFQSDPQKSDDAISKSDRAIIDPEIAKMLRDDLAAQYLAHAPHSPAAPGSAAGSATR